MTHPARFARVFSAEQYPKAIYDEVLFETADWVATPTLGSILPNWLLIIPKLSVLNFAQWRNATGHDPVAVIDNVVKTCGTGHGRVIWFEHGASAVGSAVGCGVEHAHLHILIDPPFSFDEFGAAVATSSQLHWNAEPSGEAYRVIDKDKSYFLAASGGRAIVATNVESVGSQFFRRVIAGLIDSADTWDYKLHPHLANVEATVRRLRRELV